MICLVILLVFPVVANASTNNNDVQNINDEKVIQSINEQERIEKINKLIAMLNEYRANKELEKATMNNLSTFNLAVEDEFEKKVEVELSELGVSKVSEVELNSLIEKAQSSGEGAISPMAYIPIDTSTIDWRSYRTTYTYKGVSYEIQHIMATGKNGNANLADGRDSVALYTNKQIAVQYLKEIGSMYVQKAIGLVNVVSWLPYEFLFSDNSKATNNSHRVTYRSMNNIDFAYVKKTGQSDSKQKLSYISNYVTVASTHVLAGYRNGTPYSRSTNKSNTMYGPNYASVYTAVLAYLEPYGAQTGFVNGYKFYNHNKTASISESVLNPEFPIQVY